MTNVSTDTFEFTITVIQHANLQITNPVYPTAVESGEDFDISYQITNTGAEDTCYGEIMNIGLGSVMPGSDWEETIAAGATETKIYTVSGGITENLNAIIEVGYVK